VHNDSHLITGLSSASARREAAKRAEKAKSTQEKGTKLKPHMQIIDELITRMRDEIKAEVQTKIYLEMKEQDIKTLILGAKWADAKLVTIKNQLQKALRAEEKL
jgi:PAB1-binding protein PBP1